jgi:hypothetical protein
VYEEIDKILVWKIIIVTDQLNILVNLDFNKTLNREINKILVWKNIIVSDQLNYFLNIDFQKNVLWL